MITKTDIKEVLEFLITMIGAKLLSKCISKFVPDNYKLLIVLIFLALVTFFVFYKFFKKMKTKSKNRLINILRALQCIVATILLYLSLCAVFYSIDSKLSISSNNLDNIKAEVKVTPKLLPNSIIDFERNYFLVVPKKMMSPKTAKYYDDYIAVDYPYSRSSLAKIKKEAVTQYLVHIGVEALVILIIGLVATGIKYLLIKKYGC